MADDIFMDTRMVGGCKRIQLEVDIASNVSGLPWVQYQISEASSVDVGRSTKVVNMFPICTYWCSCDIAM